MNKRRNEPNFADLIINPIEWITLGMLIMLVIMGMG